MGAGDKRVDRRSWDVSGEACLWEVLEGGLEEGAGDKRGDRRGWDISGAGGVGGEIASGTSRRFVRAKLSAS